MQINFSNDKPIFMQFADIIKSDIISDKFKTGDKLPSVRDFALNYAINPNTVQKSLQLLEDEGLIVTDRTNGKFVAGNTDLITNHKNKTISHEINLFVDKMKSLGLSTKEIKALINKLGE